MNKIEKNIRFLAEKASQGTWWIDSHGHCMMNVTTMEEVFTIKETRPATRHPETMNLSHWNNDWDASYIAAVQPKNVKYLLGEIDELRSQRGMLLGLIRKCMNVSGIVSDNDRLDGPTALMLGDDLVQYLETMKCMDEAMAEVRKLARSMKTRSLDGATRSAILYSDDLREYADRLLALAAAHRNQEKG